MKKKLTRILAALLIAMMLIPTLATFSVSAEETSETIDISDIENLYKLKKLDAAPSMEKVAGAKDGEPTEEMGMLASESFAVTRNDDKYIYVGPCPDPRVRANTDALDYIVYWYNKDGKYTSQKKFMELGSGDDTNGYPNIVGEFPDGSVILKIRINQTSYKYAALKLPTTYPNFILATCERPFTVDEYFAYADAQGWELDGTGMRPLDPVVAEDAPEGHEGFWNYFSPDEDFVAPSTQKEATNRYQLSDYIRVTEGDVITIGAVSTKENQSILYAYSDETISGKNTGGPVTLEYKSVKQFKKGDVGIDFVENIGYDYAIYSYTVAEGVSFVKVSMPESTYGNGDVLVTKNQEFKGAQFRQALEIPALSTDAKNHNFSGKNALFVGDSIFAGEYDTPASFSNPSTAFARRLALATGLNPTVFAATGATIGQTSKSNVKYAYNLLKTALMSKKNYDMVIFQGGINDARQNIEVGEILPVETAHEVLIARERTATFIGGLQLMFNDARVKWPEAKLYYIASYKTIPETVKGKDMNLYYAQAKALCAVYDVHYIDLYNDAELYDIFDYTNTGLFADDKFTPISATYNLLFPTVLRLFNETLSFGCIEHIYDSVCDKICNQCGFSRQVEHVFDYNCDTMCNVCGYVRDIATHTYDNVCDSVCNYCGYIRVATEHIYDNTCDVVCNECKHVRDGHYYNTSVIYQDDNAHWFKCTLCGQKCKIEEHDYSNNCDPNCNVCSKTRVPTHSYDDNDDTTCNICGDERIIEEHVCEEVSGWKAFWNSIMNFFRRLFGQPEICTCGEIIEEKK